MKPLFRWEQDPCGGEHGVMVLWPGTARELRLQMPDFRAANSLGISINGANKEAFEAGRMDFKSEVVRALADSLRKN